MKFTQSGTSVPYTWKSPTVSPERGEEEEGGGEKQVLGVEKWGKVGSEE